MQGIFASNSPAIASENNTAASGSRTHPAGPRQRGQPGGAGPGKSLSRLIAVEAGASGVAGVVASLLLLWSMEEVVLVRAFTGLVPVVAGRARVEVARTPREGRHRGNARQVLELMLFCKPVVLWTAFALAVFGLLAV